jgi:hypothetical protein
MAALVFRTRLAIATILLRLSWKINPHGDDVPRWGE